MKGLVVAARNKVGVLGRFCTKKIRGDQGIIVVIVLILVAVALCVIFRNQMSGILDSAFKGLKEQVNNLFNAITNSSGFNPGTNT